mgnify:CR=1 FL=1
MESFYFKGTDFNAEKYANYLDKEVIWQNTFRLASALSKSVAHV